MMQLGIVMLQNVSKLKECKHEKCYFNINMHISTLYGDIIYGM